jgi:hypothetical protein
MLMVPVGTSIEAPKDARADRMKAQLSLQRALGSLLEANNIVLENAIREQLQ